MKAPALCWLHFAATPIIERISSVFDRLSWTAERRSIQETPGQAARPRSIRRVGSVQSCTRKLRASIIAVYMVGSIAADM